MRFKKCKNLWIELKVHIIFHRMSHMKFDITIISNYQKAPDGVPVGCFLRWKGLPVEIVWKKIKDVQPYEKNPRRNDDAVQYVAESIRVFGWKQPIVIDQDGIIVAGHTRLKAAKKLGLKEVPCIVADDLTDEQVKAYRLADNKVSEASEWDFDLLFGELDDLIDFDMSAFGFGGIDPTEDVEPEEDPAEPKPNERERTMNAYNLDEFDQFHAEGFYQMPVIDPVDHIPDDLIGFNYALTAPDKASGIHFYIDDYQFERVWNQPLYYLEKLAEFDCMLTPDFSLYTEMPIAMKIWNTYRSRLIGQMAQRLGIIVIPTVSWCEEETFRFCFDGLPKRSVLSISTIGVKQDDYNFSLWKAGVDEMIKRLHPRTLLIYGGQVDYDFGKIKTVYFGNKVTERMKGD